MPPIRNSFKCWSEEITSEDVTICWTPPWKVAAGDRRRFHVLLTRLGKTDTKNRIASVGEAKGEVVFTAEISDPKGVAYSLFGLEPSCAYSVVIRLEFAAPEALTRDYTEIMGIQPVGARGELPLLES